FIWEPSVQDRPPVNAHDLVVAVAGGENLRDAPSGRIAARLHQGTVLQGLVRDEGWVEVRRTGWIWSDALEGTAGPLTADTGGAPAPGAGTPSGGVAAGAGPPSPAPDAVPGGATVGAAGGAGVGVAPPPALPAGAGGAADWLRGA